MKVHYKPDDAPPRLLLLLLLLLVGVTHAAPPRDDSVDANKPKSDTQNDGLTIDEFRSLLAHATQPVASGRSVDETQQQQPATSGAQLTPQDYHDLVARASKHEAGGNLIDEKKQQQPAKKNEGLSSNDLRSLLSRAAERVVTGQSAEDLQQQKDSKVLATGPPSPSTPALKRLAAGVARRLTSPKKATEWRRVIRGGPMRRGGATHYHYYTPSESPVFDLGPSGKFGPPVKYGPPVGPPVKYGPPLKYGPPENYGPPIDHSPAINYGPPIEHSPAVQYGPPEFSAHPHHVTYRPAYNHDLAHELAHELLPGGKHYDEDARSRAAVFDAVWRALKSAAGGAIAIGGTLARNGGRLLQAKGRLMASNGPLVVALGRQIAEDALHHHKHPHNERWISYEELSAAADVALAQREHARHVAKDLFEPLYESTVDLGGALRVAATGTVRALGDLVSELAYSAKRAYLLKE